MQIVGQICRIIQDYVGTPYKHKFEIIHCNDNTVAIEKILEDTKQYSDVELDLTGRLDKFKHISLKPLDCFGKPAVYFVTRQNIFMVMYVEPVNVYGDGKK
jgi:uncharacterized protein YlbG (UPF0298 family)